VGGIGSLSLAITVPISAATGLRPVVDATVVAARGMGASPVRIAGPDQGHGQDVVGGKVIGAAFWATRKWELAGPPVLTLPCSQTSMVTGATLP
jgi:hypothetical protein